MEELSGSTYNSCLLNFYRTGMDHMSFHSDNEPLYGGGVCTIGEHPLELRALTQRINVPLPFYLEA